MTDNATRPNRIHEGRNVKRFREMLGIKQEALAFELGEDWNQRKVSLLEQKETIDVATLQQVSAVLKVPVEAFQNFDEEQVVNIVTNTFTDFKDNASASPVAMNYQCTINTAEKWLEALEEIKRLNAELLKVKDEQIELLKGMVK
jgi:transcriptional regulator with XRE-family HTH domain